MVLFLWVAYVRALYLPTLQHNYDISAHYVLCFVWFWVRKGKLIKLLQQAAKATIVLYEKPAFIQKEYGEQIFFKNFICLLAVLCSSACYNTIYSIFLCNRVFLNQTEWRQRFRLLARWALGVRVLHTDG